MVETLHCEKIPDVGFGSLDAGRAGKAGRARKVAKAYLSPQ
jgi:hypothetical protein